MRKQEVRRCVDLLKSYVKRCIRNGGRRCVVELEDLP